MTFISTQEFDADGNINVIVKRRRILETSEAQDDGSVKGQARIKFEHGVLTRIDLVPIGNLRGAEAMALEEGNIFWGYSSPPINHIHADSKLAHMIGMASANVGTFSKRGNANTIVCHPTLTESVRDCFTKMKTISQYDEATQDMIDVEVPYFKTEPNVIENDMADTDKVLVLYCGEEAGDQALIYVEGEGLLKNSKVAAVEHYGKFVRIP
jgi:hypothetical protein